MIPVDDGALAATESAMTSITINTRITWVPTESGAEQWNRTDMAETRGRAVPGEPLSCQLHEFMFALGPIVGTGSGAAMPAASIDIEVTRADRYAPVLRDLHAGALSYEKARALIVSIDRSITAAELYALLDLEVPFGTPPGARDQAIGVDP